ncbi:MAG: 6-bladed beta-propeller [Candidatus Cloacimonetes bacterium]|nr:6-bladed beta-propeller [Candidatus Cloacimonadota bacterium]
MKIRLLITITVIFTIISCSVEQKIPEIIECSAEKVTTLETELIRTIDLEEIVFEVPTDFEVIDSNIYLLCIREATLKIFDNEGNLIINYNKKGKGPGELSSPMTIINNTQEELIEIPDAGRAKIVCFDYSGNYLKEKDLDVMNTISERKFSHNFYAEMVAEFSREKMCLNNQIKVVKPDTTIVIDSWIFDFKIFDMSVGRNFVVINENVFVATQSVSDYFINQYNADGINQKKFVKKFAKVRNSDEHIAEVEKNFESSQVKPVNHEYMSAITKLLYDDNHRLWVQTIDQQGEVIFDIINSSGEIIHNWIPEKKLMNIFINDNKIYELSWKDENEDELEIRIHQI